MGVKSRYFVSRPQSKHDQGYYIWQSDRTPDLEDGDSPTQPGEIFVHPHYLQFSVNYEGTYGYNVPEKDLQEMSETFYKWGHFDNVDVELENVPSELVDIFKENAKKYLSKEELEWDDIVHFKRAVIFSYFFEEDVSTWL